MSSEAAAPSGDGVAAREAAAVERERVIDEREADLEVREADLEVRESLLEAVLTAEEDRGLSTRRILDDAQYRDEVSDARDADADDREVTASRAAFLDLEQIDQDQPGVRRAAALDRRHSKSDRTSAAVDRAELAGDRRGDLPAPR